MKVDILEHRAGVPDNVPFSIPLSIHGYQNNRGPVCAEGGHNIEKDSNTGSIRSPATVNTLPSLPESISGRAWREGATEDQYTSFSVPGTWLRHNLRQGVWKFGKVCCMKRQNPLSS